MKYLRFLNRNGEAAFGIIENDRIYEISSAPYDGSFSRTGDEYDMDSVNVLSPSDPNSIFCIGTNYMDHIRETKEKFGQDLPVPENPLVFLKARNTIAGPGEEIEYPKGVEKFDYEGELGVIISRKCRGVSKEDALEYVSGYTCANDLSARDFQFKDGQWARGKSLDKFCPFGPVVTDEIDIHNTRIRTRVNGELVQDGTTADMIFDVPAIVSFISEYITLQPGDLIITGTPCGVGRLKIGDTIEVDIEGIGVLKNTII